MTPGIPSVAVDTAAPSGTVTLLFTDIEGSTALWDAHPDEMRIALARHDALVRTAVESAHGYVFKTVGDAFCAAFAVATDALRAAVGAQRALACETWPEPVSIAVRMALHAGECVERDGDYFGTTVNRVARLEALAHGEQVILSGAVAALLREALPAGVTLRDMGQHRLKDLAAPEHVFQVDAEGLRQQFPPLRSLDNPVLPNNLPQLPTGLIGREREVAEIGDLVDKSRLVTITGAGGAGKTRVALQVAADLLDGSGAGVWLVELAKIKDAERVPSAVAGALGIRESASGPSADALVEALGDDEILIVLDNCEQVIGAAAGLADRLLRSCPSVHLIATSRVALGVEGEHVYRLLPLAVPAVDASPAILATTDSVRLFVERARAQRPGFAIDAANASAIAALTRRLDGMPLALELAAARMRSMTAAEIADRLDQRFRLLTTGRRTAEPRQQTLRAAIDWSYDLLDSTERDLLCRASVFLGGFDRSAAEAVLASNAVDGFDVLDIVDRLVDNSLLQHEPGSSATSRYRMLESIRDYASERLAALGPPDLDDVRRAYLDHFARVAAAAGTGLSGPDQAEWARRLAADHDNLLGALAIAVDRPDGTAAGLQIGSALSRYWTGHGDCRSVIGPLRELCDRDGAPAHRAAGYATLAFAYGATGDLQEAIDAAQLAVDLARTTADSRLVARALRARSAAVSSVGDHQAALADADEACALADAAGDVTLQGETRFARATELYGSGDVARAHRELVAVLPHLQAAGDLLSEAGVLVNIADIELANGDLDAATGHLDTAVPIAERLGNLDLASTLHLNTGLVAARRGDAAAARDNFGTALAISDRIHANETFALSLIGYADSVCAEDPAVAASYLAAAARLREGQDASATPNEARLEDDVRERLEVALTTDDLGAAYDRGRTLSRPELLALRDRSPLK